MDIPGYFQALFYQMIFLDIFYEIFFQVSILNLKL